MPYNLTVPQLVTCYHHLCAQLDATTDRAVDRAIRRSLITICDALLIKRGYVHSGADSRVTY